MNVFSACAKSLLFFLPLSLWAEDAAPTSLQPAYYGLKVTFFLLLVLGLIVLLAWLVNKTRAGAHWGGQQDAALRIVAVTSLGLKEKIAVVQVGEKQVLVGITPHNINLLTELEQPLVIAKSQPVNFADLLKKAIRS